MLTRELQKLGIPDYEARILAVLYEQSPLGASPIAKKLALSRSSVYTAIAGLTAKGLVSTTYKNEVKQFVPASPDTLARLVADERKQLEEKEQIVEDLRQHVAASRRSDLHVPQVMLFEGVEGLQRIYLAMLRDARPQAELRVLRSEFLWESTWSFAWTEEWRARIRRWKQEKDVRTKLLVNPSTLERGKADYYRTRLQFAFRYLPPAHAIDRFAFYVIGDTAAIMSFETGNLIGIKIVNAHLATNFIQVFDGLWDLSAAQ
ncbi:MAG: helix-turn-helix domain-containing protein [bacterium]|nr:helix-turn-helix domain-containing protein [bacterium]